jgi:hypothetical protein
MGAIRNKEKNHGIEEKVEGFEEGEISEAHQAAFGLFQRPLGV